MNNVDCMFEKLENCKKEKMATKEIIEKATNEIYGVPNLKNILNNYVKYIKLAKKNKINFGNYNFIIHNNSNYDFNEKIIETILQILKNENIIESDKIIEMPEKIHRNSLKDVSGSVILVKIEDDRVSSDILNYIKLHQKDNIFILLQNIENFFFRIKDPKVTICQNLSHLFYWTIEINCITEKEKRKYIKNFLKDNKINIINSKIVLNELEKREFYNIKSDLLNILIYCKTKRINTINSKNINKIIGIQNKDSKNDIKQDNEKDKSLVKGIQTLDELIGLEDVKKQIKQIINFVKIRNKSKNMPAIHMIFEGNPGCGKNEVARLVGKIFKEEKILTSGKFIEVQRADLIGKYVGYTAQMTKEKVKQALGGVLFIDEAYTLFNSSEVDFGHECIATLLKEMEDNRNNLCVIMAGYTNEMQELIKSNPGLESRIPFKIKFNDYSNEELYKIFLKFVKDGNYKIDENNENIKNSLCEYFNIIRNKPNFANAREVRNLYEKVCFMQADRLVNCNIKTEMDKILFEDILNAIKSMEVKFVKNVRKIGF